MSAHTYYPLVVDAFRGLLNRAMLLGEPIDRRNGATRELVAESFTIHSPRGRCIVTPHRRNNIAATAAETVWLLAGRSDLEFLSAYLPRAVDYSDDGLVWRAGYGARLRHHFDIDQLDAVRQMLLREPLTRRAVMVLFDPRVDLVESKDIPCNNWLQFLVVDGRLDLSVTARSLDIMWGFSGVNSFTWSVAQELMAAWVGLPVGRQHWFVGSAHLYERHLDRATRILDSAPSDVPPHGWECAPYRGTWAALDTDLATWFEVEAHLRGGEDVPCLAIANAIDEPLLASLAVVVAGFWDIKNERSTEARVRWLAGSGLAESLSDLSTWLR